MQFPIILFDLNKKKLSKQLIVGSTSFYFYCYQIISVRIINYTGTGTPLLYSVINNGGTLEINPGNLSVSGNFGYTLIIPDDRATCTIEVTSAGDRRLYNISLNLDNVINDVHGNAHYSDLLTNYYLPSYAELNSSTPNEFNQRDLIKRLLLDFRNILKYKGTKKGIEQFFNMIGYADKNLQILDIWKRADGSADSNLTLKPNTKTDTKTGDYHILYANYVQDSLDADNLPVDAYIIDDLTDFKKKLINSIVLANTYFTVEEQMIVFFGLEFESNIPQYQTLTTFMTKVFEMDVQEFRNRMNVDASYFIDSKNEVVVVKDKMQTKKELFLTESKYSITTPKNNDEIYFVDGEVYDDEIYSDNFIIYEQRFCAILHFTLKAPETYFSYKVEDVNNPMATLTVLKQWQDPNAVIIKQVAITKPGEYRLTTTSIDTYGNKDEYHFDFTVKQGMGRIDFTIFNSSFVSDDFKQINGITQEVGSSQKTIVQNSNFVLSEGSIPYDLSQYYAQNSIARYFSNNDKYAMPNVNQNLPLRDITETLNTGLFDNWLYIVTIPYAENWTLKIRIYDGNLCEERNVDFSELRNLVPELDTLYIQLMDIKEKTSNVITPWYFISTTKTGLEINKSTFNFVLVDNNDASNYRSIFDDLQSSLGRETRIIPVNYDFPLFNITSELVPSFLPYISPATDVSIINGVELVVIKSVFPRLINVKASVGFGEEHIILKQGDVVFCKLCDNLIISENDVRWIVKNSFTGRIVYTSSDATLKYRIADKSVFTIICEFSVNGQNYSITKESVVSSFEM